MRKPGTLPDCSDAEAREWIYGPVNGNFYASTPTSGIPIVCVNTNVPNGIH